ncbi:CHRD domain-containing protein [Methylocaldum szegediense]|uniref:CHRD domain-containing protein n=1 Tax=Methylocaldum szegediense TaxID=73780 RepID=A0ABN8X6G2_9GAMM|nr:CHRD domain-containing protein [Methylocaldum szegediense]CAI8852097.1 CHRD domain-containing protein [Methylocaldum szegediense]
MNRFVLSILLSSILAAAIAHGDGENPLPLRFGAVFGSSGEIPVQTDASMWGQAGFAFDREEAAMVFVLTLTNGANVTGVQLHCGTLDTFGPAIVPLLNFLEGSWNGTLQVQATVTETSILRGVDCFSTIGRNIVTLPDLAASMRDGNIFVNVTSAAFPDGEIRGQVQITSTDLTFLAPPGTIDSAARVPLQIGGESGAFVRIVTESPATVISQPSAFNPPLREFPSSSFNPPLRDRTSFPSPGFNPP